MNLYSIECGNFKLDGGAMFGVVPKPLWERTNPADSQNRIKMATRSLLIEDGKKLILIDCGLGDKQNEKFFSHFDRWGAFSLVSSLKKRGFSPDDVTDVVFTHLHFDHCGGAIIYNKKGLLEPFFKNASFWCHQKHWEWAINSNKREKASFLKENIMPIQESGQLRLIEEDGRLINSPYLGFNILLVDGHTEKQMLPIINYKGQTIVFAGDLIPTLGHLPIPYIMGYDTRPLLTLEEKSFLLDLACRENYLLYLEHDPYNELISLKRDSKGVTFDKKFTLSSFFGD